MRYVCKLELWNRILISLIKVGCPLSDFPILSDFLTGKALALVVVLRCVSPM